MRTAIGDKCSSNKGSKKLFRKGVSLMVQKKVVFKYRAKNKIEEAFREMKSQLALRPVYLTRPERVKAHVSLFVGKHHRITHVAIESKYDC